MSLIAGNLGVVQRMLDASPIKWGICAGAAAHLYGDRRPLQDVDMLVAAGKLPDVVRLLQRTREDERLLLGGSPRSGIALLRVAKSASEQVRS